MTKRGRYEIEVRVSFHADMCWIVHGFLSILRPILEAKRMQFWIVGASTVNLEGNLESYQVSKATLVQVSHRVLTVFASV